MTDWTSLNYVVVDVEGNGYQPPDLVELAVVRIVGGVIGELSSWLVRPLTRIKPMAESIHGITNEQVAGLPLFESIKGDVRRALEADALVAHNAHVDVSVLQRKLDNWAPVEVFDTLKLSRRLMPGQPSYRLGSLVEEFNLADGVPSDLKPHRATYDALMAARLFIHIASQSADGPLSLEALRDQPPRGGKHEAPALF
ncbi:3'-5' exonuclease [Streptacidiphilus sp. P02-A3a]|uniref:3'-5' exonuclease n=1 Tax=Streptacidiphilus sp. P02-A3a TaxID=2704468 RepID=UPI0015FC82FE|nr:3'-5' exonuclease [Streptacidiphilus sp. P02-A3a]QMU68903.1 3'-5' exonuclease [Streptacidiphilus sp. P02-A3a]